MAARRFRNDIDTAIGNLRRAGTALENHVIDEFVAGRISRRELLRVASVIGIGLPAAGLVAGIVAGNPAYAATNPAYAAAKTPTAANRKVAARRVAQLRVGVQAPGAKLDPITANSPGALVLLGLAGEYLSFSNSQLQLEPRVATGWTSNAAATEWTFRLRRGITFHNGQRLTADDVVATFDRLTDPANKSNASSVFNGVLKRGATTKVDDATVKFALDVPSGAFPYLVSSDNYNAIILPRAYGGDWEKSFIGSGPWVLEKYVVDQGVTFKRNPTYWDPARQANAERLVLTQFKDDKASLAQLVAGRLDAISFTTAANATALTGDTNFAVLRAASAGHLQLHLRSDKGPFADKRIRQAFALTLDRDAIVKGVLDGFGTLGNDSPMAPVFPTTDKTVAQRKKDLAKAKALLAEVGKPDGFEVTLSSWGRPDIKLMAQVVQASAKEIGVTVKLDLPDDSGAAYYDDKRTPSWLSSDLGITDYGHRGVPNVYLQSAYTSAGTWNAAHYSSAPFDDAAKTFLQAPDIAGQRAAAKRVQEILLDDTPVITTYFQDVIQVHRKGVAGLQTTGMAHLDTGRAVIS